MSISWPYAGEMKSKGIAMKWKRFRMSAGATVRTALPYIFAGGALGALIGSVVGSPANGFRVGVILGGAVAFVVLQQKEKRVS